MHTKRLLFFYILLVLGVTFKSHPLAAQQADRILGRWQDAAHPEKQVEFFKKDNRYVGRVIKDGKSASEKSDLLFRDLVWSATSKSYQGILINPDNGDEYGVAIRLLDNNTFQFKAGRFIFFRTFTFKRIES